MSTVICPERQNSANSVYKCIRVHVYIHLRLAVNICPLCLRACEHMFAEHMFAHVRREHMFAGGRFLKSIISWCFAPALSVFGSSFYETVGSHKMQLCLAPGFPAHEWSRF